MTSDLINRSVLLSKAILLSDIDGDGWKRVLRAVPVAEIEAAEAVDAAPVVHGRWERCFEDRWHRSDGNMCTACGYEHYGGAVDHYHYCPNCGANMDGEA